MPQGSEGSKGVRVKRGKVPHQREENGVTLPQRREERERESREEGREILYRRGEKGRGEREGREGWLGEWGRVPQVPFF